MKKVAIVSACLLGEYCRYDGKTKEYEALDAKLEGYEIVPFCPEKPLGTPRERISVVGSRVIADVSGVDVTKIIENETKKLFDLAPDLILLKSKSPSCGNATTPILNEKRELLQYGDGKACELLKSHFKGVKIVDETML